MQNVSNTAQNEVSSLDEEADVKMLETEIEDTEHPSFTKHNAKGEDRINEKSGYQTNHVDCRQK